MFSRVLHPTDCSERARSIVGLLSGLHPRPEQVCAALVVHISGLEQPVIEEHLAQAQHDLDRLTAPLKERGIDVLDQVLTGRPMQALLKTAEKNRSDVIVLGTTGKDAVQEVLKGSLSAGLTRQSDLPVLSLRFGALWDKSIEECAEIGCRLFSRLLLPTDMSECSQHALEVVRNTLSGRVGRLELVHVVDDDYRPGEVHDREVAEIRSYLERTASSLAEVGLEVGTHLVEGDPVADILRLSCELDATCIVIGSHGKSLMREAVVGSVSQGILRMANRPVLVMH